MKVGFIGTGSMGSILIESFIRSGALQPHAITVSNRTASKAHELQKRYDGLGVARFNAETVAQSDIVFICVKPLEFKRVIDEISTTVTPEHIIVSITSPVFIHHLEQQLNCKIAKVIPSITNSVCSGASLCIFGSRMQEKDRDVVENLFSFISMPQLIDEHYTRVTSDLSSCGPAFICYFLEKFIEAAVQETGLPEEDATMLASHMLLGTGKLLTSGHFTPASLQKRVAVPSGITAEGLRLMSGHLDGMFNQLIRTTHAKYEDDIAKLEVMFSQQQD